MTKKDREFIANFMQRTDERLDSHNRRMNELSKDIWEYRSETQDETRVRIHAREEIQAYVGWWGSLAGRVFLWGMAFVGAVVVVRAIISCMR